MSMQSTQIGNVQIELYLNNKVPILCIRKKRDTKLLPKLLQGKRQPHDLSEADKTTVHVNTL